MAQDKGIDFAALAAGIEQMREGLAAAVAGLIADGFTDREARMIIAGVMAAQGNKTEGES